MRRAVMLLLLMPAVLMAAAVDVGPGEKKKVLALAPLAAEISGYYECSGVDLAGKKYRGMVSVRRDGDVYFVQWLLGGGTTFSGVGLRQGDSLSVGWCLPLGQQIVRGVNHYRIESCCKCAKCECKGGCQCGVKLCGRWAAMPGPPVLQSETLKFLRAMDPEE